jgi:hypothetical protein
VRNDLWEGRTAEGFYDAMAWLYGWKVETCLADRVFRIILIDLQPASLFIADCNAAYAV